MSKVTFNFEQMDFSRVAVIGSAGSGKTTLSKTLGELLGKEVTHLDKILWGNNWQKLTHDEQLQVLKPIVATPSWIIDGMWAGTLNLKYPNATLVIFLDYKRTLCVWRAFWRAVKTGGRQRDDMALGCVEKVDFDFLKYIWDFPKNTRPKVLQAQADNPNVQLLTLKTPKQTKIFVKQMQQYLQKEGQNEHS